MKQISIRTTLLAVLDYAISTQKQMSERALNSLKEIILGGCAHLMKYLSTAQMLYALQI